MAAGPERSFKLDAADYCLRLNCDSRPLPVECRHPDQKRSVDLVLPIDRSAQPAVT